MDSSGIALLCQSSGDDGGFHEGNLNSSTEPPIGSPGSDGQHHHPFLSEPHGRDEIPLTRLVSSGEYPVVPRQARHASNHPSFGGGGTTSKPTGCPVADQPTRSDWTSRWSFGLSSRKSPTCSFLCVEAMGRPICNKQQPKSSCLLDSNCGPSACRGDAVHAGWSKGLLYLFPPILFVPHKVRREEASVITETDY